jgi:hypothetical protein
LERGREVATPPPPWEHFFMSESGASRKAKRTSKVQDWSALPEQELLRVRLKDLHLTMKGTWLERCLEALHSELAKRNINVRPHGWLSDEWFSPDNTPGIAFPFYLAHPRLIRLERKNFLEAEGGTKRECMQILRHEAGHVVQHSFNLHRRRKWRQVFGSSSQKYPSYYRPDPSSRNYVQHLRRWYAQSHPDEDFAETFAVWLTPRSSWRKHYAGWPALEKLRYVDELMEEIAGQKPLLTKRLEVDPISKASRTLGEHYARKHAQVAVETHAAFDKSLHRIFSTEERRGDEPAATFLRRNRAAIMKLAESWAGEYQVALESVLDEMINRCRVLKLRAHGSESQLRVKITSLITKQAVRAHSDGARRWYAV